MTTLRGKPVCGGAAIATAAVVREKTGIAGVSPDILQHGVDALRQQLTPQEYPEIVVVCDNAAAGATIAIPGVRTIGIAAESESVQEDLPKGIPCVVGVKNLLGQVAAGEIVIVDGDNGLVHIDPDPRILISYQNKEEVRLRSRALFIESKHIPAKTQDGHTVAVFARVVSINAVAQAIEDGADGLVVEPFEPLGALCYDATLRASLGKPVAFLAGFADKELLHSVLKLAAPDQVSIYFPLAHFAALSEKLAQTLEQMKPEPIRTGEFGVLSPHQQELLDRPRVIVGALAGAGQEPPKADCPQPNALLVDLRPVGALDRKAAVARSVVERWIAGGRADQVSFDVGERVTLMRCAVEAGARTIVTVPGMVAKFKNAVRAVCAEEDG